MPRKMRIGAGDRCGELVARERYGSASEARIEALRAAIIEGEQSGVSTPFDIEAFIARKRQKRGRGAAAT
jgi:Arc/MetJ-type ribon-helix-helix transcriptional regulator